MRIIFASFCLFFFCFCSGGQAQAVTGIKKKTAEAILDSAEMYKLNDPARSVKFALRILDQVPPDGNEMMHAKALIYASNGQKMLAKIEEALDYASQAIAIAHKMDNTEVIVRSYFQKATIFGQLEEIDSAVVYFQHVINYHRPGIDPYFVSSAYTNIGQIYANLGNNAKAEEYLLEGYRLASTDEYSKTFALTPLVGYYVQRDNPKYLPYLDTFVNTEFYQNASPASIMAHFDSFLLLDQSTDAEREKTLKEVYAYSTMNSALTNQISYGLRLYNHLEDLNRFDEAHRLLLELRQKAIEAKNGRQLALVIQALSENSKLRGAFESAILYLEQYSHLRDSIVSEENRNRISELNIQFETAQKDHQILEQEAKIVQERRTRDLFILVAFLLASLALVVWFYFKNKAASARRIAENEKIIHQQETERLQKEKVVAELTATLESQERERNRIAMDLHDGLGSMMSGISSQIEYLRSQPSIGNEGEPHLAHLREMVKDATSELRRTSYELMPAKLLRQGLEPAMRDLCLNLLVKNGIEPTLEINTDLSSLNSEQQLTLYRIIQELLNNIVKHAEAKNVLIQFNQFDHEISLIVEDDGKGFDISTKKIEGGLGLGSLQSRVNLLKGFLDIASLPGQGTTVTVNFNLEPEIVRG